MGITYRHCSVVIWSVVVILTMVSYYAISLCLCLSICLCVFHCAVLFPFWFSRSRVTSPVSYLVIWLSRSVLTCHRWLWFRLPSSVFRLPSSIIRDGGRGCLMLSAGHSEWVTLRLSTAYSCTSILLQPLQTDRPIHPTRYLVYCPGLGPSPDQHIFSTLSVL